MKRYAQFLRRKLPSAVQSRLEAQIEQMLQPVEGQLKLQLIELVRDAQLELHQLYVGRRRSNRQPTPPGTPPVLQDEEDYQFVQRPVVFEETPVVIHQAEQRPLVPHLIEAVPDEAHSLQDDDYEHLLSPVLFNWKDYVDIDSIDE